MYVAVHRNFAWCVNKLVKLSVSVIIKASKYIGTWRCRYGPWLLTVNCMALETLMQVVYEVEVYVVGWVALCWLVYVFLAWCGGMVD